MIGLINKESIMNAVANILVGLVAVEHIYILIVEMFLWTKPYGLRAFGNTPEHAQLMAVMAKNQGLYNGFLAAGLFFGLWMADAAAAWQVKVFFVSCVIVAGVFGGATTGKRSILIGQAGPALLALVALIATGR
jgi:putative membrane protein